MVVRVKKEDSAYLYQILESYDGLTNYSTLPEEKGTPHRDIELHIAPDFRDEVVRLVERLQAEIQIEVLRPASGQL